MLLFPNALNIKQSGAIALYETIEVQSNTNWFGDWSNGGEPQFGFVGAANVYVETANPGIYAYGNGIRYRIHELAIQGNQWWDAMGCAGFRQCRVGLL